ncbi:MAG: translation initiation factor 2, partial [Proteobacteria bacterium]|nr:translation initiation factor 2 [Pseudomonadota bacterium]
ITSEPSGASVKTSLGHTCTTPCTLTIDRKQGFTATYTLAGYQEQSISVNTQTSGAGAAGMAGNILIGGVVGVVADAATGATLDHVPNPVHAVLVKAGPAPRGSVPRR